MQIREVIFQGIFGCDSAVRIAAAPGLDRMNLPANLSTRDVQGLLLALLYPEHLPARPAEDLQSAPDSKLAVVLEDGSTTYRVLRRSQPSSLRLQVQQDGKFTGVASGKQQTVQGLVEAGRPPFETFASLNLWRFDDDELFGAPEQSTGLELDADDLADKYRRAVKFESLEDRVKSLEGRLDEHGSNVDQGAKIEEKLHRARAKFEQLRLNDLSDDELDVLSNKDKRLAEFDDQINRLGRQEDEERTAIDAKIPRRVWRVHWFWVGLIAGVAALAVSLGLGGAFRRVAAVDVIGFGLVAWVLLKYFTDLERSSVHQVRLESIRRRLNQVREQQVTYHETIDHMLIHAGVDDEQQLLGRLKKSRQLEDIISQLEDKAREVRRDPAHRAAIDQIDALEAELAEARAELADMPEVVMSAFQLERDLRSLGIEPHEALAGDADGDDEPDSSAESLFGRLRLAAEQTNQWSAGGLAAPTRKMWGKICGHVLSDRFSGVELSADGQLKVRDFSDQQLQMWRRTRSSEERILAAALAVSIQVNIRSDFAGGIDTIWIADPAVDFGAAVAQAFDDVFESAARRAHVVLCAE